MTKSIFSLSFLLFAFSLNAQVPDWEVNPASYAYNMTVTGALNINYSESSDENDIIAAFMGDECRGTAQPVYNASVDRYICYLMVYSDAGSETITFKIYDASTDEIHWVDETMEFQINGIVGQLYKPYIWSDPTLSNESEIISYNIPGQLSETNFDENDIYLTMPFGTDLSSLTANFTLSPYALIKVPDADGNTQESGVTANNLSNPVNYWVRSADETDTTKYTVTVRIGNYVPTDIFLSDTSFYETTEAHEVLADLTTEDYDNTTHSYSLISGTGDTDNGYFYIEENKLKCFTKLNYETNPTYSIRLRTDDGKGGTFEKAFTLSVIPVAVDEIEFEGFNTFSPNNDGINDYWQINNNEIYRNCSFYIYDNTGIIVYKSQGYNNDWDGKSNGKDLPIGVYCYVIKSSERPALIISGTISLIR